FPICETGKCLARLRWNVKYPEVCARNCKRENSSLDQRPLNNDLSPSKADTHYARANVHDLILGVEGV
ncbi:hypothetical protein STEG23_008754, partial [Scotinomys teguina]